MTDSLFMTGATGFVGSRLLGALDPGEFDSIRLLVRDGSSLDDLPPAMREAEQVEIIRGDLESPECYAAALEGDPIVVHLAALTGAARPEEYEATNVRGVAKLLEACAAQKVSRFLHISTIAALYPSLSAYPYGRSKKAGEALVGKSDLDYTIVRPTVVADRRSEGFQALVKLACAPLLLQPGPCQAKLRPIDLEDLVSALVGLIRDRRFRRESFDLGGPESLSALELMQRIRLRVAGRKGPVLRLPLSPLLAALRALEALWPGVPPVTAGQFSVFRFDGVGEADRSIRELGLSVRSIDAMLERSLDESHGVDQAPDQVARRVLERECVVFYRYLMGRDPDPYLLQRYCVASGREALSDDSDRFEELLVSVARRHPVLTRAVDIYARWFHPRAKLRRKLILMLAIAETWAPSYAEIDRADEDPQAVFYAKMAIQGAISFALGTVAALLLQPIKLLLRSTANQSDAGL